jgi:hypothetical protein
MWVSGQPPGSKNLVTKKGGVAFFSPLQDFSLERIPKNNKGCIMSSTYPDDEIVPVIDGGEYGEPSTVSYYWLRSGEPVVDDDFDYLNQPAQSGGIDYDIPI